MNSWKLSGYLSIKNNLFLRYVCIRGDYKKKKKVKWREKIFRFDFDSKIDETFSYFHISPLFIVREKKRDV